MTISDFLQLAPLVILTLVPVVLLLAIGVTRRGASTITACKHNGVERPSEDCGSSEIDRLLESDKNHFRIMVMSLIGLGLAFLSIFIFVGRIPRQVTPLLIMDGYGLMFMAMIIVAGLLITLISYGYLKEKDEPAEEYYVLLLLATLGAAIIVSSNHLAGFFLGLEVLNISLYALIAYTKSYWKSLEAGFKYIILAAASDAFLLFGMALIYAETGSLEFSGIFGTLNPLSVPAFSGLAMLFVGIGFKLAFVPFQMWTPDVYEGAPAPVTAFIATISKGAVFAVLFRLLMALQGADNPRIVLLLTIVAVASMFVGNLLALAQNNIKRILAYSSIAHMGYLLIGLLARDMTAVGFYFAAYFIAVLGAFGVVAMLSGAEGDADDLDRYRGLAWQRPWLAVVLTAALLSLAGIPITAGFVGKFFLMAAGVGSSQWLLVGALVINSVIGLYYYLRIIVIMYLVEEGGRIQAPAPRSCFAAGIALSALMVFLVWLGVFPGPFISILNLAFSGM